jgi:hypothetical protein
MILDLMPAYPNPFGDLNSIVVYVVASVIIALSIIITIKFINKKKEEK